MSSPTVPVTPHSTLDSAVKKAAARLVPLLVVLYAVNYLDRVNVGYAALKMNADLGLSSTAFGLGAGLFFIGYVLFEVPSNLILRKVGARVWIARIMMTWGVCATAMAFVDDKVSFYVVRFVLGVSEAGFLPGILLYLTQWFPSRTRSTIVACFFLALPLSTVLGAPLSALLMQNGDGLLGLRGWQFMFFVEGVPAVLIGLLVFRLLPSKPADAKWLTPDQREKLIAAMEQEENAAMKQVENTSSKKGKRYGIPNRPTKKQFHSLTSRVYVLCTVYLGLVFGFYLLGFFMPQLIKDLEQRSDVHFSLVQTGLLTAVPYVVAAVAMIVVSRFADRRQNHRTATSLSLLTAGVALAIASYDHSPVLTIAALSICAAGVCSALPPFWHVATGPMSGRTAAIGIAIITSVGNLSGFLAPYFIGAMKDLTGGFHIGLLVGAVILAASGTTIARIDRKRTQLTHNRPITIMVRNQNQPESSDRIYESS